MNMKCAAWRRVVSFMYVIPQIVNYSWQFGGSHDKDFENNKVFPTPSRNFMNFDPQMA